MNYKKLAPWAAVVALSAPATAAFAQDQDPLESLTPLNAVACLKELTGDRVRAFVGNVTCSLESRSESLAINNMVRKEFGFTPLTQADWDETAIPTDRGSDTHFESSRDLIFTTGKDGITDGSQTKITISQIPGTNIAVASTSFRVVDDTNGYDVEAIFCQSSVGFTGPSGLFTPNIARTSTSHFVPMSKLSPEDKKSVDRVGQTVAAVLEVVAQRPELLKNMGYAGIASEALRDQQALTLDAH